MSRLDCHPTEKVTDATRTVANSLVSGNFAHTWKNWLIVALGVGLIVVLVSRRRLAYYMPQI